MRLLISVVLILVAIGVLGFLMTNLDSRVTSITVWTTEYRDVLTFNVVVIAMFAGFVFTAVIAIVEGARLRLENRRLKRQIQAQESEINYLRTQPRTAAPPEPDALEGTGRPAKPAASGEEPETHFPTAPVYDAENGSEPSGADDDFYTGGRAV